MRKIFGSLALLVFLAIYIVIAVKIGGLLTDRKLLSIPYYLIAGIAWALPLKPLLLWMHAKDTPTPSSEI